MSTEKRYSTGYFSKINTNQAKDVFKFLADANSSASGGGFEWGLLQLNNGSSYIGTTRTNESSLHWETIPQFSNVKQFKFDSHSHSHPNATYDDFTYGGDRLRANSLRKVNPNIKMSVYMPQLTLSRYNKVMNNKYYRNDKGQTVPYGTLKILPPNLSITY